MKTEIREENLEEKKSGIALILVLLMFLLFLVFLIAILFVRTALSYQI